MLYIVPYYLSLDIDGAKISQLTSLSQAVAGNDRRANLEWASLTALLHIDRYTLTTQGVWQIYLEFGLFLLLSLGIVESIGAAIPASTTMWVK